MRFPVTEGYTLVIPRRLAVDWGDVTTQERLAILALVDEVKSQLAGMNCTRRLQPRDQWKGQQRVRLFSTFTCM